MTWEYKNKYWERKKNPSKDLNRIGPLLFGIGLVITLLLVNVAFNWKSYDLYGAKVQVRTMEQFEELMDVPPTTIPPPVAPTIQASSFVEVKDAEDIKDDLKVTFDVEVTEQTVMQQYTYVEPAKVEEEVSEEIFVVVEQTAVPRDGLVAFYKYVAEKIHYPAQARRMGIEGKVYVEFVVDKEGTLSQITVVKGIGAGCDEEAVRIIEHSPPWSPGRQRGKPCRQRMVLPINFKIA